MAQVTQSLILFRKLDTSFAIGTFTHAMTDKLLFQIVVLNFQRELIITIVAAEQKVKLKYR